MRSIGRLALILPVFLSGCVFAATQTAKTARGGYGELLVIQPVRSLESYKSVKLPPFTNAIGNNMSSEFLRKLNAKVANEVSKSGVRRSGGKSVRVAGRVIHLDSGILRKQIVVQVKLADAGTGRSLGLVNVAGKVEGARGLDAAADGVAFGVVKLLANFNFPGVKAPAAYK